MAEQIFMGTVRLHPLAQREIERKPPTLLGRLVRGTFPVRRGRRLGEELATRIAGGGFPAPLARKTSARRAQWYADYIDSLVQRDVRDLARIGSLHALACGGCGKRRASDSVAGSCSMTEMSLSALGTGCSRCRYASCGRSRRLEKKRTQFFSHSP